MSYSNIEILPQWKLSVNHFYNAAVIANNFNL